MDNPLTRPRWILHLEGGAALAASIAAYVKLGYSGWLFAALLLAPDLGMLGYAGGPRLGAATYNATHITALPLALLAYGVLSMTTMAVAIALIWLGHIGLDRMLGFGLKYPTAFKDTHLGRT